MSVRDTRPLTASILLAPWFDGPPRDVHVVHRSRLALSLADETGRVAFSVMFPGAVRLPYACTVATATAATPPSSLSVGDGVLAWGDDETSPVRHHVARWWSPARPAPGTFPALTEAVDDEAVRRLARSWRTRLGQGPGLTPYADDVLCGALISLRAAGHRDAADLTEQVAATDLEAATTATSAALLRAACEGWCIDELADHLRALDRCDAPAATRAALVAVGSSSGHGLLAGVALVLPDLDTVADSSDGCAA